jgi:hypothetical protein
MSVRATRVTVTDMPLGDSTQARADYDPMPWKESRGRMSMLADVVDAVVGGDTHCDTHTLELIAPSDVSIATVSISNDERGFVTALAWIIDHGPVHGSWSRWKAPAATEWG